MFYVHVDAVKAVEAYVATTRQSVIRQARQWGGYDQLRGKLIVAQISQGRRRTMVWEDAAGNRSEVPVSAMDADQRRRLFINGPEGGPPSSSATRRLPCSLSALFGLAKLRVPDGQDIQD